MSRATVPLALLVESDGDTREMYAEWLAHSGLRVAQATSADEAMAKACRLRPHVITTDLGPFRDDRAYDLCQRLKSHERTRGIPVIAVTAWSVGGHVERARRAGCDAVLLKPCLPELLLAEIHRLLGLSQSGTMELSSR